MADDYTFFADLTFLNCMTRFMRLLVVFCACWVVPMEDCSRSSIEILFFRAWYSSFCLVVCWQYMRISICKTVMAL